MLSEKLVLFVLFPPLIVLLWAAAITVVILAYREIWRRKHDPR